MFKLFCHATPGLQNEYMGIVEGAYIELYIDYKDIHGVMGMAHFYVADLDWVIDTFENDYEESKARRG